MLELATPADRMEVNRLARQVHQLHVDWRPDIYRMPEELFPEDAFLELIRNRQLYVAKLNGILVGYALVQIRTADRPDMVRRRFLTLDQICVEEAFRRKGIGSRIIEDVKALARAFGCAQMQLGVYPENEDAVAFYQKNGFLIRSISMQLTL